VAGYSGKPLVEKLGIKPGMRIAALHAPDHLDVLLEGLPEDVSIQHGLKKSDRVDMILGFVTERAHLEKNIDWLRQTLPPDGAFWVAWPKRASKVPTEMNEDVVREVALPTGLVDVKVCAIDDTWAGLKLMLRKELRSSA
jgi:hypothetical protein